MRSIIKQRHLLLQLVRRDLAGRYRGSMFGVLWMLLTPLLMLAVYSFVFGVVFKARGVATLEGQTEIPFAILLYSGLILHAFMAEVLPRSVTLLSQHPNYIKKVVFPVEFLPLMAVITAMSLFIIQLGLLMAVCLYVGIWPTLSWLWVPALIVPYMLLVLGLSWLLAALGLFLPDLNQVMGLLMTVLLFMSPIFYSIEMMPEQWQNVLMINPLTFLVEALRNALFYPHTVSIRAYGLFCLISLLIAVIGYRAFKKLKPIFSDVV